jgi:hypothetical protein
MTRKSYSVHFLVVFAILCLSVSYYEAYAQVPEQSRVTRRKHAENLKLIHRSILEELNGESHKIVHIGERLISIDNGKKHYGDSISYRFNSNQELTQQKVYDGKRRLKESTSYEYNSTGNLESSYSKSYDRSGVVAIRFFYNDIGQIISKRTTSSIGIEIEKYQYDELNCLTETRFFHDSDSLLQTMKYSYDERGNLVLVIVKLASGDTITTNKYAYNKLNQCIQKEHYGEPINCVGRNRWQIRYNKVGDVVEEGTDDLIVSYKYEYDGKRNWIKQYQLDSNETSPNFLTTRVIIYRK